MERLTYFKDGYWRVNFSGVQYQADFVDRLAAYEDSRLSPEDAANLHAILRLGDGMTLMRLRELAVADKDGRCVVLPCKVGDILWITGSIRSTDVFHWESFRSARERQRCWNTNDPHNRMRCAYA